MIANRKTVQRIRSVLNYLVQNPAPTDKVTLSRGPEKAGWWSRNLVDHVNMGKTKFPQRYIDIAIRNIRKASGDENVGVLVFRGRRGCISKFFIAINNVEEIKTFLANLQISTASRRQRKATETSEPVKASRFSSVLFPIAQNIYVAQDPNTRMCALLDGTSRKLLTGFDHSMTEIIAKGETFIKLALLANLE